MDLDRQFLEQALGRIMRWMLLLVSAGAVAATVYGGWRWGLGYLLGASASYLNFHWLKRLVNSLGEAAAGKPPRARVAVILGLRYLLLGLAGYAILNYSTLSLTAALMGLFVSTAAVILEMLFELIYAGI
jgi:hypothetical protein